MGEAIGKVKLAREKCEDLKDFFNVALANQFYRALRHEFHFMLGN